MSNLINPSAAADSTCLVEIIELKWLLAGHGVRLHVEMLQQDGEYARHILDHAASLDEPALQHVARKVRARLILTAD